MLQTVRITSKRQITIPVKIFKRLKLNKGDRLSIEIESNKMVMQKAQVILDNLAGSVKLPNKYKNKPIDYIIRESKKEYFRSKK
jgi:AbrB family looped-hinge helix DNA binding protein